MVVGLKEDAGVPFRLLHVDSFAFATLFLAFGRVL